MAVCSTTTGKKGRQNVYTFSVYIFFHELQHRTPTPLHHTPTAALVCVAAAAAVQEAPLSCSTPLGGQGHHHCCYREKQRPD